MAGVINEAFTPEVMDLWPVREYRCHKGCVDKVYTSRIYYNMHLKKVHDQSIRVNSYYKAYHCPQEGCVYHCEQENAKSFRQLHTLRSHYQRCHMPEIYKCDRCENTFCMEKQLLTHPCLAADDDKCIKCGLVPNLKDVKSSNCKICQYQLNNTNRYIWPYHRRGGSYATPKPLKSLSSSSSSSSSSKKNETYKYCEMCDKRYIYKHTCSEFVCFICPHVFDMDEALYEHLSRHLMSNPDIDNDQVLLNEMLLLLNKIESNEEENPQLIQELIDLYPLFQTAE
ncbi:uncharacterized protein Dwil_GK17444 [Drosophila willistoni]|uniref:C2H2-type domain-containing protein n=1 Tax=Drosophila willistoni TaxID=7260 RepID=B4MM82_DROWI|nr:zinc finger protein 789 [Drosophila willistoni]EDW73227.1 uncharacterized protein Dwil_GK17444 [Drosophila willistoni]